MRVVASTAGVDDASAGLVFTSADWVSEEARESARVSRRRPRSAGCGQGSEGEDGGGVVEVVVRRGGGVDAAAAVACACFSFFLRSRQGLSSAWTSRLRRFERARADVDAGSTMSVSVSAASSSSSSGEEGRFCGRGGVCVLRWWWCSGDGEVGGELSGDDVGWWWWWW